jgi:hypothetical protein
MTSEHADEDALKVIAGWHRNSGNGPETFTDF